MKRNDLGHIAFRDLCAAYDGSDEKQYGDVSTLGTKHFIAAGYRWLMCNTTINVIAEPCEGHVFLHELDEAQKGPSPAEDKQGD